MIRQLDDLDKPTFLEGAADHEAAVEQLLAERVVDLVAMTVPLGDHGLAVDLARARALAELHRLCSEASPDQILISQRIHAAVTDLVTAKEVGPLQLKGFHRPVVAYEVIDLKRPGP